MYAFCSRSSRSSSASGSAGLAAMNPACSSCRMPARKICCSRSSYVSVTINAMNAPTWAAFAPGVLVSGRIVSATSSSKATSCALKVPAPAPAAATPRWARSHAATSELPPTNATPPSSAVTRRIASRRSIMDLSPRLQVVALQLTHGEVRRARRERHVRERRVLTRRRYHTGAVRDEDVRRVPHLVVRVEHRRLGIATHARRPHLMDPHPREALVVVRPDVLHARRLERLGHVVHHVPPHQALVLAVPISWIPIPGKHSLSYVRTFFMPAASSVSAMSFIMSRRIRRSFSPVAQSIARTGSPHLSFLVASIVTRFAWLGSISPKAVAPMLHGPGWAMASLKAPPTPSSATARDHP